MATIGHKYAVADAFGHKFTGLPAYLMWGVVHVAYLVGWGNRLGTIYTWARALYLSKNRGHRMITFDNARANLAEGRPKMTSVETSSASRRLHRFAGIGSASRRSAPTGGCTTGTGMAPTGRPGRTWAAS